jgi:hypothetical protein
MHSVGYLKTQGVVGVEFPNFGNNFTVTCVNPNHRMNIITVDSDWTCISSNDVEAKFEGPYSNLTPEMILAHLNIWLEVTQVEEEKNVGSEKDSEDEDVGSEDEDVDSEDDDW